MGTLGPGAEDVRRADPQMVLCTAPPVALRYLGLDVGCWQIVLQKSVPCVAMIYAVQAVLRLRVVFGRARLCRGILTAFASALSLIGLAGWS